MIKERLKEDLAAKICSLYELGKEEIQSLLERPKDVSLGDIALPCFALAKKIKTSPISLAKEIASACIGIANLEQAVATGPFVNFSISRKNLIAEILTNALRIQASSTLTTNEFAPQSSIGKNRVLVEYSSPNIAKPFHVGHLRATLIGNCLDRVNRYLGNDVISINHLGDWGTQFGYVWAGCQIWGKPQEETVRSLVDIYRKATGLKAEQESSATENNLGDGEKVLPEISSLARNFFVDLENGTPYALEFWNWCLDISLRYFKKTYARLDIAFDHYTGESFYSDKLEAIKIELEEKDLLVHSQGALGVQLDEDLGFARIYTPDGRSLYLTRDLAAAKYRAEIFHFDRAIYVVGAPQTLHFRQLKAVLKAMGHGYADKIEHVAFGHVLGMKTRGGGEFLELNDVLEEAHERALAAYREQVAKRPEGLDEHLVAEKVALSAICFSNLCKSRLKDVTFSWKHALEFQGDTGPYLLYALARINGIKEKAAEHGVTLDVNADTSLLTDEASYQLILQISEFSEAIIRTAYENEPQILTDYSLGLAKCISRTYLELKVIGADPDIARSRLLLFDIASKHLALALSLLGIPQLERM